MLACAPIEDSDQPAHPRMLIRVFNGRSIGSQGSKDSSGENLRDLSDCADAHTDWYFTVRKCQCVPYVGYRPEMPIDGFFIHLHGLGFARSLW